MYVLDKGSDQCSSLCIDVQDHPVSSGGSGASFEVFGRHKITPLGHFGLLSARREEALPTRWAAGPSFQPPCDVTTNGLAGAAIPQVRCMSSREVRGGGLVSFLHSFALLLLACLTEIPYTPGNSVALTKVQRI